MDEKIAVVDRGVDEVLIINGQIINITHLSGKQLINVLNTHGLTDIPIVSYDEFESTICGGMTSSNKV